MDGKPSEFVLQAGKIINSGQSRSLLLSGNVYDLFRHGQSDAVRYLPLTEFLVEQWRDTNYILAVYEINGPIRFVRPEDEAQVRKAWVQWRTGHNEDDLAIQRMLQPQKAAGASDTASREFDVHLQNAVGNPTLALEVLRQLCLCSRSGKDGAPFLTRDLLIVVEAADLILPPGEISSLSDQDRRRVSICHDWFSDPGFAGAMDAVVLLSESRSLINSRVAQLPQVVEVPIPAPDQEDRADFITWFQREERSGRPLKLWSSVEALGALSAGLSLQALQQLLKGAVHSNGVLSAASVVEKVEAFICSQLAEDMIEFKKPAHTLDDVVGFSALKQFLRAELMPRFRAGGAAALPGAAVCGPVGSGKTFLFEAVAAELDVPVLVLKNIRSQWFGQTDVLFERLRRVLAALSKVVIFVDEADTQFGDVGPQAHDTERRLTGKIQAMMSDPLLRGRVVWLLMTARIHLLSADIRRPGRVGDLIIPVLDPEAEDRGAFAAWMIAPAIEAPLDPAVRISIEEETACYSAASYAALRSELTARRILAGSPLNAAELLAVIGDHIPPEIQQTRRYQTLQALLNCTRRSLLPGGVCDDATRESWQAERAALERSGVR